MSLDVTVTDLFCGAGGSSQGAEAAGARLVMAANHWRLAIETHSSNFPHADHDCADISQVDPRRYPSTDVLIASPECTNHSQAKAHRHKPTIWDPRVDPGEERSRATMWDVPRFAERHRYQIVIIENVVEARRWEPYPAWLHAMTLLGYEHRELFLNSAIAHPTPQSRDRLYVVFWRRGNPAPDLDVRVPCWCSEHGDVAGVQAWKPGRSAGKYRAQYVYACPGCGRPATPYAYPAASAIDWSLPAPRIGDRARPLADATLRRIRAGLERYGPTAIVQAAGHTYEHGAYFRTWPTSQPMPTQTGTAQHALVVDTAFAHASDGGKVLSIGAPLMTQTGQQSQALVVPAGGTWNDEARSVTQPFRTRTGVETEALVVPLRRHGRVQTTDAPLPTVAAAGNHHALLVRQYSGGAEMAKPVTEPAGTITARDHHALVTAPFLTRYHSSGGQWSTVTEPAPTVDTRDRIGLVEPAIDVDDCGFRMLEPHEIGRAMAFPDSYVVKGNKRDRVRQYGNAVTPPVMALILGRAIASLRGAA